MKLISLQVNYLLHSSLEYFNVSSAAFNFGVVVNVFKILNAVLNWSELEPS